MDAPATTGSDGHQSRDSRAAARTLPFVSLVVPVYESAVIEELVERAEAVLTRCTEGAHEIILVEDGSSTPDLWPTLARLARERSAVKAVQLSRNFGQQAATLCGLAEARGDLVVTIDDDLQHAPEDIPLLLAHAAHDIVIAQWVGRRHHALRRLASCVKGFFDRLLIGKPRGIQLSSFRLLSRAVVDGVLAIRTPNPFLPGLMLHVSKDVVGVPVTHHPRRAGKSGYTIRSLNRVFSNLLINNSSPLLRLVGYAGILLSLVSFALAAQVVFRRLVHGVAVLGWASLFAAVLCIGGALLFSVGVVGEYLIRILDSSERRPCYFVRRRVEGCGTHRASRSESSNGLDHPIDVRRAEARIER
jgi:dolichol-phosphate mannosyltransferase/undecaprenyl-phosphate 4-deoxy-4-formamido-L-arabinose transferase